MSNLRIAYIINDAAFFVSHRLPIAIEVLKQGGKVCIITGQNISTKILETNHDHFFVCFIHFYDFFNFKEMPKISA